MGRDVHGFLRDLWTLTRPYWFSDDRWPARALLAAIVAITLLLVYLNVLLNDWNGRFFNALQSKDEPAFWNLLLEWGGLVAVYVAFGLTGLYLRLWLRIRWRLWLTGRFVGRWLDGRAYYRIALIDRGTDNPDQRIAEDLRQFVDLTLSLTLDLIDSAVTLASFLAILWVLSGSATILGIEIPGYMVWVALVYAIGGTVVTHLIGRRLIGLTFDQQRVEADFRFGLVRFRENAEAVALYRGEADEKSGFLARFAFVVGNWRQLMTVQKNIYAAQTIYSLAASIFPIIVASPRYFAGAIQLGGLTQTSGAFGQVQSALSYFVSAYQSLATWKAVVDRLTTFEAAVDRALADSRERPGVALAHGPQPELRIEDVTLALPDGRRLIAGESLTIAPGERVIVTGPSGSGKSTLFRACAGIWPFGGGRVLAPAGAQPLFLPQRPYLPIGTLGAAIAYPARGRTFDRATLERALDDVGLGGLKAALDEHAHWQQRLSGGEQQRIALARALVQKPDWLFLDEATSAVDEQAEAALYEKLRERLPGTTLISIGHRSSLRRFHGRELAFAPGQSGAPATLIDRPVAASG